jgi:saccharopepsin
MKAAALAALFAGGASAGVHKMKLDKVSLQEQLEMHSMEEMGQLLGQKYSANSARDMHLRAMFSPSGGHRVPVTNFANAQCTSLLAVRTAS